MIIEKKATIEHNFKRVSHLTSSAREAWSKIIDYYKAEINRVEILLPGYIGWSQNEGSGIFDSVKISGVNFNFYRLNQNLQIDFNDLKSKLSKSSIVLLVHYFGFPDRNYNQITDFLKNNQIHFVEDCAHAWLSDLIGGICGRKGKFSFYSLHKLLPYKSGGLLVNNDPDEEYIDKSSFNMEYDLYAIYNIRRQNYLYLVNKLKNLYGVSILHPELIDGVCPQTLPVLLKQCSRDNLYFSMNEDGYGFVSLYHTMIKELQTSEFNEALYVSKNIINFPIHQDICFSDIDDMFIKFKKKINA